MAINFNNVQQLPFIPNVTYQTFDTVLEGITYTINARWNSRGEAWYMDILDANASPIASGLKLVLGVAIGRKVTDPRFPGIFFVSDLSNADQEASFDDFGTRVVVYFYPIAEWLA